MKKMSIKKLSILGVVLMGASALTAAILPGNSAERVEGADNGTLQVSSDGGLTCIADATNEYSCNITVGTTTSAGNEADSFSNLLQTEDNTSVSAAGPASSVVI